MASFSISFALDEINQVAAKILAKTDDKRIFLLEGEMGAGKTTLIKALSSSLGVEEYTSSPTFAIVNAYQSSKGTIYHFDLFRLRDADELRAIGFSEYLDSGNYVFIEWPEIAMPLLDGYDCVKLSLSAINPRERLLEVVV